MASTMKAFTARGICAGSRSAPVRCAVVSRKIVAPKAIFGNLFGGASKPASGLNPAKVQELQTDIIKLAGVGSSASPATLAQIQSLVKQLAPASVKGASKSDQLFGEYEIIFSSTPLAGANPRQVLSAPNKIVESTESKAFGLLTVTTAASGQFRATGPDSYEVVLSKLETKGGLGGGSEAIEAVRSETVLFLDDKLRVVRVSDDDGESIVISKRRGAKIGAAASAPAAGTAKKAVGKAVFVDDDEEEEEEPAPKRAGTGIVFPSFGTKTQAGIATISEREVRRKMEADSKAGAPKPRLPTNLPPTPSPTAKLAVRPVPVVAKPAVDPRAAAAAKAKEAEAAKAKAKADEAARAKAASAAKEKAEAERKAAAEKAGAIKAQLEELSEALRVATADARDAAKEVKDVERSNTNVLRSVATARGQVAAAAEDVADAESAVVDAGKARAAAENALKAALSELQAAQGKVKAATARK